MKHLRLFESFDLRQSFIFYEKIHKVCRKYGIGNYNINKDGTVDVYGNVDLHDKDLKKLPVKFGKVTGYFSCFQNQLTSLDGCPNSVGDYFSCSDNQLTSLKGCPREVGHNFICRNNQLTSLEGGPEEVGGGFSCSHNKLTSLKGSPREVGGNFNCEDNQLKSLDGGPIRIGVGQIFTYPQDLFNCIGNPIYNVYNIFGSFKEYQDSLDYNYLRGTDIVKSRFQEALEEIGKTVPKKIKGYNYI